MLKTKVFNLEVVYLRASWYSW